MIVAAAEPTNTLEVVQVGSFEASFVPALKDFVRLDGRFRLPEATWDALPGYKRYGFAVFKLKKDAHTFHPMAFEFPRAEPGKFFFPTVHIHDGHVHAEAYFDHELYCQRIGTGWPKGFGNQWRESPSLAGQFVKVALSKGLVTADAHCYLQRLNGALPNRDTWA